LRDVEGGKGKEVEGMLASRLSEKRKEGSVCAQ
jgi:hypothetical protein